MNSPFRLFRCASTQNDSAGNRKSASHIKFALHSHSAPKSACLQDEKDVEKGYNSDIVALTKPFTVSPTVTANALELGMSLPLEASNGGVFISRGQGRHPARIINTFELIFVKEGVLSIQEADHAFEVRGGDALILWPDRRHHGTAPYLPDLTFYWLHFQLLTGSGAQAGALNVPQHVTLERPDHLTSLFRRFLDDQEAGNMQPFSASLLVLLMLSEVAASSSPRAVGGAAARLAGRADALIRTHFHEPLSTSSVARTLRCNPDYLGRVFQNVYGCTLTDALHQRRLKFARRLLLEGDETVEQIAVSCGFRDVTYFRRLFKRREGVSPRAFRQLYSKMHVNTE